MSQSLQLTSATQVVMIIAHEDFRDEELIEPRKILEAAGAKVAIASSQLSPAKGMLGGKAKPDLLVKDIMPSNYQAIVFIGGMGSSEYWDDPAAHALARSAAENPRQILAAICLAPVTLAKAGVLKGKKATVWKSEGSTLSKLGANYSLQGVCADGRIITAGGPQSAKGFGEAILKALAALQNTPGAPGAP